MNQPAGLKSRRGLSISLVSSPTNVYTKRSRSRSSLKSSSRISYWPASPKNFNTPKGFNKHSMTRTSPSWRSQTRGPSPFRCGPIRLLPTEKINLTIEQIYSWLYERNTELLKQYQFRMPQSSEAFFKDVEMWMEITYKTQQLAQINLLQLHDSLKHHLSVNKSYQLTTFQAFFEGRMPYKYLMFFLFVRQILRKYIDIDLLAIVKRRKTMILEIGITQRQISKLILAICGDHKELLDFLTDAVRKELKNQKAIETYRLMALIVSTYEQFQKYSEIVQKVAQKDIKNLKLSERIEQDINRVRMKIHKKKIGEEWHDQPVNFWRQPIAHFDGFQSYEQKAMFSLTRETMRRKVKDLVNIMLSDDQTQFEAANPEKLFNLIQNKACLLLEALFKMDKVRWFQLLRVHAPNSRQLQHVQAMQLRVKNARRNATKEAITDLCKRILMTEEFKEALQQLVAD